MGRSKFGKPKAGFGEIKIKYGYKADEGEDLYFCHGGHEGSYYDARRLMNDINLKRWDILDRKFGPSIIEDLESRGYDITTMVISIRKKPELLENTNETK